MCVCLLVFFWPVCGWLVFHQVPSAELPSGEVDASLDVKKPKKGLLGTVVGGLFKTSKAKIEVRP